MATERHDHRMQIPIEKLASGCGLMSQLVTSAPAFSRDMPARAGRDVGTDQGEDSLGSLVRNAQLLRRFFERERFKLDPGAT